MPYQTAPSDTLAQAARERPLESIADATRRINNVVVGLTNFVERWHGIHPKGDPKASDAPEPNSHSYRLERMFEAIARLEESAAQVDQIG